ncbi:sugar ABC transporter permease [Synergistales bacterium]|nr:sugar ABC transporter permease [Synergistales bacterium]
MSRNGLRKREPPTDTAFLLTITICMFMAMYILAVIFLGDKGFSKPQTFFNLLNEYAALIVLSCGLSVVMISGGIDISVGGVTALICMTCVVYLEDAGGGFLGAVLISLGIGLAFGVVHGFLVAYLKIQPFIVTLAGMFFARGATALVNLDQVQAKNAAFTAVSRVRILIPGVGSFTKRGVFVPAYIEIGVIVALLIVILLFLMLKYTKFGRGLYAVGGNAQSALMLGINVSRTKFFAYVLTGLLAGVGGMLYFLHTGSGSVVQASGLEMDAIASSIIGGTLLSGGVGNIIGTLFGVLIRGTIYTIVTAIGAQGPWWTGITISALLCFFIVLQSVITSRKKR